MDTQKLLQALDDPTNESLLPFTTQKILEMNLKIVKQLHLNREDTLKIMKKIRGYKYVDEMNELKYGTYIRWIFLQDPTNIEIQKGAIFCEIKITDKGVLLVCKNFGFKTKYFSLSMDECLIFQKMTDQELVLLSVLDHLHS